MQSPRCYAKPLRGLRGIRYTAPRAGNNAKPSLNRQIATHKTNCNSPGVARAVFLRETEKYVHIIKKNQKNEWIRYIYQLVS